MMQIANPQQQTSYFFSRRWLSVMNRQTENWSCTLMVLNLDRRENGHVYVRHILVWGSGCKLSSSNQKALYNYVLYLQIVKLTSNLRERVSIPISLK